MRVPFFLRPLFAALLLWAFAAPQASAQYIEGMTQRPFGKNRVQFKDFDWRMKSSPNFEIYYYDYGSGVSDYAILYAEAEFNRIADLLGFNPSVKTRLMIYNSLTDLQQSNIGLDNENRSVGGQTDFVKPKIEIPFTGNLYDFKQELSFGIAQVFIIEMMFGGSIREMLQNAVLMSLPDWFTTGMAAYVAEGWSSEMDDYMRNAISHRKLRKPHRLDGPEAKLVGQSIWNFIALKYGEANIASILNLTRIIRNEETSIASTLGIPYDQFIKEWRNFYLEMAQKAGEDYEKIDYDFKLRKRNRRNKQYNELKFSNDGRYIAYSENTRGKYKVYVRDMYTKRKKRKKVFVGGFKLNSQRINHFVPLLSWTDDNRLAIAYKRSGETEIAVYDLKRRKKRRKPTYKERFKFFNQITGFDISADGTTLAISSDRTGAPDVIVGTNDLYLYNIPERDLKKITQNDLYDDTDPVFIGNSNEVVLFSSNRVNDTLKTNPGTFRDITNNYNLFIYNAKLSEDFLDQLTDVSGKAIKASIFDEDNILYLNDENGIQNLYKLNIKTKEQVPLSNFSQDVRAYSAHAGRGWLAMRFMDKRKEILAVNTKETFEPASVGAPTQRRELLKAKGLLKEKESAEVPDTKPEEEPPQALYNPDVVDTDDYQFDPEVLKEMKSTIQKAQDQRFSGRQRTQQGEVPIRGAFPYEANFSAEKTVFTPLIDPLRGFGILFEVDLGDLFEDHRFSAGALGITDLRSSNYYAQYQYLGKRVDFGLRYDRKSISLNQELILHRYILNRFQFTSSYPFTNSSRIAASVGYQNTQFVDLGVISNNIQYQRYALAKLEYMYDDVQVSGLNMFSGTRAKVSYEYNFDVEGNPSRQFDNLLIDIRNYQPIDKDLIFATRLSFGRFGGAAAKRYMLGGMDNWLGGQIGNGGQNNPLAVAPGQNGSDILFHEFATSLRGFDFNHLAGENFAVFNAELRVPLIKYLLKNSVTSNFFKNLQFTAFGDIGTAWTGAPPWDPESELNTRRFLVGNPTNPTFDVTVRDFKNPLLAGYGLGIRTLFLGYYLKVDMAWSVEDFIPSSRPRFYFTIGYDF